MKNHTMCTLLLALVLLALPSSVLPGSAELAATPEGTTALAAAAPAGNAIQAASCSQTDVQAAVDAASDGDFVLVPAGHCTWTTPVAATPAVLISGKGVTIWGAGIGQTVITDATGSAWRQTPFWIEGLEGHPFRITGFSFTGQTTAVIMVRGTCKAFRIDHCQFDNIEGRSIMVSGETYGVIDHCQFTHLSGQCVWVEDGRGDPPGSTSWASEMSYGTAEAVFAEDNTFIGATSGVDGVTDCRAGGRYVLRHSIIEGLVAGNHGLDSATSSCLQMEIYDNVFRSAPYSKFLALQSRGGSAIMFNNTITGDYGIALGVTNYRSCCYAGASCSDHGQCDGANPIDGNTEPQSVYKGWPCKDQIGRGAQQSSQPLYEWNNTYNGSDVDVSVYNNWPGCTDPQPSDHVQENRDYYNDAPRPDYTPYVYPHPLTQDLVLSGTPDNEIIQLDWIVAAWTYLPPTTTWQIAYQGPAGDQPSPVTGILSPTQAYSLTGLTNYTWYTVTLNAMVGAAPILTDTVHVRPPDQPATVTMHKLQPTSSALAWIGKLAAAVLALFALSWLMCRRKQKHHPA
ncbi:MAG: hypothetical protein JW850_05350 [Thermoflexales bacterium]|nr:hypothetical protein [Thermoflexales bacterium]